MIDFFIIAKKLKKIKTKKIMPNRKPGQAKFILLDSISTPQKDVDLLFD